MKRQIMAKKDKQSGNKKQKNGESTMSTITRYGVVCLAGLAGFVAYSSGASLEGALARTVVVLFICTLVGYIINVYLMFTLKDSRLTEEGTANPANAHLGTKLDLVADDDRQPMPERKVVKASQPGRS
jgi:hypothetical protein